MDAVLSLVPAKVQLTCLDGIKDVSDLPKRGTNYQLAVIDWNAVTSLDSPEKSLGQMEKHSRLKKTPRILLYPHQVDIPQSLQNKNGFKALHKKPFLTEELARILTRCIKEK